MSDSERRSQGNTFREIASVVSFCVTSIVAGGVVVGLLGAVLGGFVVGGATVRAVANDDAMALAGIVGFIGVVGVLVGFTFTFSRTVEAARAPAPLVGVLFTLFVLFVLVAGLIAHIGLAGVSLVVALLVLLIGLVVGIYVGRPFPARGGSSQVFVIVVGVVVGVVLVALGVLFVDGVTLELFVGVLLLVVALGALSVSRVAS